MMIVEILMKTGDSYYTRADSLTNVKFCIDEKQEMEYWWYNNSGKKYEETMIFVSGSETIHMIRTDDDADVIERLP